MILKAFRGNGFEFLLEILTLNSRRFYHNLPTRRTGAPLLPPSAWSPEQLPDSQYRRRTHRSRVCFPWDCVKIGLSRHNPFMLSGDFGKWARETGSYLAHKIIKFHFFT
jgi:hypothetical protein